MLTLQLAGDTDTHNRHLCPVSTAFTLNMNLRNPEIVREPNLVIAEFAHFPCLRHLNIQLRIAEESGLVFQTKNNKIFVQEHTAAKHVAGLLAYLQKHDKRLETLKGKFVTLDHKYTVTVRQ